MCKKKKLLLTLLTYTFFNIISQNQACGLNEANQYVLSIKTKQERIEIENEYIEVYKDSTNSLTYEEIRTNILDEYITFPDYRDGFKKNTKYWLKFQIKNISDKGGEWAMEFRDIPFLDNT